MVLEAEDLLHELFRVFYLGRTLITHQSLNAQLGLLLRLLDRADYQRVLLHAIDNKALLLQQLQVLLTLFALVPHELHLFLEVLGKATCFILLATIASGCWLLLGSSCYISTQHSAESRTKVSLSSGLTKATTVSRNATVTALSFLARDGSASGLPLPHVHRVLSS